MVCLDGKDKRAVWRDLTLDEHKFLKALKAQLQAQLIAEKADWATLKSFTQRIPLDVKGEVWQMLNESEREWIEMLFGLQVPAFFLKLK